MDTQTLFPVARIAVALAGSAAAYAFYSMIRRWHAEPERQDRLLLGVYVSTRLGFWLLFAIYLRRFVTTSDPRAYLPMLDHFLRGDTPIRDFYYVRSAPDAVHDSFLPTFRAQPRRCFIVCNRGRSSGVAVLRKVCRITPATRANGSQMDARSAGAVPTESRNPVLERNSGLQ